MKAFFVSLGCDKNKVDSEKLLKLFLNKTNALVVERPEDADVAIVNTCAFIIDAKLESIEWINYLLKLKKSGRLKRILVTGCFATELTRNKEISDYIKESNNVDCILPLDRYLDDFDYVNDRVLDILSFSSFIKICDGCDKFCSYCIIPYLRGRFKSRCKKDIIEEAKNLAKQGVKELSIVGQDVLHYGGIKYLLDDLSKINGIVWIRLLYCYPEEIDDSIISIFKENKKVLPYIDMPIQHASDKILKLMNRKTTKSHIREIVNKLRKEVPDICIRTTILVGFPGETDDDFTELCDFIKEIRFDKLGVFTYSREKLSKSYDYKDQVDDNIKEDRKKKLLAIQKNIVLVKNRGKIGNVYYSIVEGYDTKLKKYVVRPYFDARDIDDKVYVKTNEKLISGTFVNVEINKVLGYDLEGTII